MSSVLKSDRAPEPIGPYVLGREAGGLLFFSGQIALDRESGEMVADSFEAEARQVFKNIDFMLKDNGLGFDNIVKTTIFLAEMADFPVINEIYAAHFSEPYPARSCVAAKGLPKGARVEIEVIASRQA